MTGVSGVIFSPMAHTYAFAIGGAIILALTLTPVLAARVIPPDAEEKESRIMHVLHRLYAPFFDATGKELYRHEGFYGKADILAKWKELGVELPATK